MTGIPVEGKRLRTGVPALMALAAALSVFVSVSAQAVPGEAYTRPGMADLGLPFSEAVRAGDMLYLSGQIGAAPGSLDVVAGGIGPETRQVMENIGAVLAHFGADYGDIVKCTVMLADMSDWPAFNEIYKGYFGAGPYPARSAFGAAGLALGAHVELECMAHVPEEAGGTSAP